MTPNFIRVSSPKGYIASLTRARSSSNYQEASQGSSQDASKDSMNLGEHFRITSGALKNWLIAQLQDSIAVGLLWLIGLYVLKVPWAPLWALLAATLQVVPHLGPVLGVIGPVLAATFRWGDWEHPLYVLMLYAGIAVVDGFLLQPYIMKRVARVPIWASLLTPIVLGILIPFWGVLLAPPLLAVVYAYKAWHEKQKLPTGF